MATKKWDEIKARLVPPEHEPALAESRRALDDALRLHELRAHRGLTQVDLARRLARSQGNISELEHREDVYLSSLREYVEALGGRLALSAVFEDETMPIGVGPEPRLTKGRRTTVQARRR